MSQALLTVPYGIAVDADGKIYFSDTYNDRIRVIDTAGMITTVAGKGRFFGDGGPATAARLVQPSDIVVKPDGNVYVLDPSGLAPGTYYGRIDVSARDAPNSPQSLIVALNVGAGGPAAPAVFPGGVTNAASFQAGVPLAPGSLISIFGQDLTDGTTQAGGLPLPARLGGTSVTIGGHPLPLLFAGANQIN